MIFCFETHIDLSEKPGRPVRLIEALMPIEAILLS